ncbi:MAG: TolC family protein [Fimbriiglobus sp.]
MKIPRWKWRRLLRRAIMGWALASGFFVVAQEPTKDADKASKKEKEDEKDKDDKKANPPLIEGPPLTLGQCLAIAYERQPKIRAALLSHQSGEASYKALFNLGRIPERLTPDLEFRKQQACRGLAVSAASYQQTVQETTQDVTVLYYSYIYAKQQEATAAGVIEQMEIYYDIAEGIVKSGAKDPKMKLNQFSLYTLQNIISEVRGQKLKAEVGRKLALEALRAEMGVEGNYDFSPAAQQLPEMLNGSLTQEFVESQALARRPELAQAAAGVDVFRLEVLAQASQKYARRTSTFASGTDLHSKSVPQAVRNGEFRPGALAPEMPTSVAGRVEDRVANVELRSQRQDALYERTQSLVRLEAAKAYLTWEAAVRRVQDAKKKYERGQRLVEESRSAAIAKNDPEILVTNEALSGKAQAEYVEAVYEHIKALAALERITAGAITTQYPGR